MKLHLVSTSNLCFSCITNDLGVQEDCSRNLGSSKISVYYVLLAKTGTFVVK